MRGRCFPVLVCASNPLHSFYDLFGRNYMFTIDMWYLKKGARRRYRKMFSSGSLAEAVDVEQDNDDDLPSFCVDAFHVGNVRLSCSPLVSF